MRRPLHDRGPDAIVPSGTLTRKDATWSETAIYACACGAMYPATRWRWIDADARPELADRVRRVGPLEGECPSCGRPPTAFDRWLELRASTRAATLVLPATARGRVLDELQAHLADLKARPGFVEPWMLQPQLDWSRDEDTTARRALANMTQRPEPADEPPALAPEPAPPDPIAVAVGGDGIPQLIGPEVRGIAAAARPASLGALVAQLSVGDGTVEVAAQIQPADVTAWESAHLQARPVHLRDHGYPLAGVRIVGSYLGQVGCIDAVVDVGEADASEVFRALSEQFEVRVVLTGGQKTVDRTVEAPELRPNAALCIESARGALAQGEYPPSAFAKAKATLAELAVSDRLDSAEASVAVGAYQHILTASEAEGALDHLDRISRTEPLARLLEVDGFPMAEYDALRRRVLQFSLEFGLCAPRRFWRRVVASGLVADLGDYANRLAANRAASEAEEGDLEGAKRRSAWEAIYELCQRKRISAPPELKAALSLSETGATGQRPPRHREASGEIGGDELIAAAMIDELADRLRDPTDRLNAATEILQGSGSPDDIGHVLDALEDFDTDELLAIMPDLSEMGSTIVPGLIAKLKSERREVRQAAVILLGMIEDPDALEPLSDQLVWEPTTVWVDVARALGGYGPVALRRLCQLLRREGGTEREQTAINRVARALAEVAVGGPAGGGETSTGHGAVAALADAADPRVSTAARRALATLRDVSESGAAIRGELPMPEVTEVRGFARRAYEAIMVPEVEVEAEA